MLYWAGTSVVSFEEKCSDITNQCAGLDGNTMAVWENSGFVASK